MPPKSRKLDSLSLCLSRPRKWVGTIGVWLIVISVLSGCAPPAIPGESDTPTRQTPSPGVPVEPDSEDTPSSGTYLIWHSWTGEDYQALLAILEHINTAYPRLVLAPQFVEAHQVPTQLLNAILAGDGPQLLLAPASWYPELKADELITPFNDVVNEDDFARFVTPALFGLIHDGQLMGLPVWAETVMLYVNTELIPWSRVPDSTDQLLEMAESAEQPLLGLYNNLFHLSWGFPAFGGVMFDAGFRVVLDQSAGRL